jgi:hypothetical protein
MYDFGVYQDLVRRRAVYGFPCSIGRDVQEQNGEGRLRFG